MFFNYRNYSTFFIFGKFDKKIIFTCISSFSN